MAKQRNPFLVVQDFVSPLTCEDIVDRLTLTFPETDAYGRPQKSVRANPLSEVRLADYLDEACEFVEEYYGVEVRGVQPLEFEWYPEGAPASVHRCENSILSNGQWTRSNNKDFVGILFLNDYQDKVPFDPMYEVRGGKLQFPTHNFGFNPKRGMLVIFPGNEYFVHNTAAIEVGELYQVKFYISVEPQYVYNPNEFPGSYETWFK